MTMPTPQPKRNSSNNNQQQKQITKYSRFYHKPFWIENRDKHEAEDKATGGHCCFNHIIGLPQKDGIEKPIFDYEIELFDALTTYHDVFIKKARGLGITEFLLRFMAWLCVYNDAYRDKRFHIVTGPRINLAEEEIDRIETLFTNCALGGPIYPKKTGPIIDINGVTIQAFPSHTVGTMRGYTDVKFILIDEADFFPIGQREEARSVSEGYRIKTRPWIVFVSTPNLPGGLFDRMEHEKPSNYHKMFFDYTRGIDKIYKADEIEKEKTQPYFEREYNLKYGFGLGNFVNQAIIEHIEKLGRETSPLHYHSKISPYTMRSFGIDLGYGSSKTAFIITELIDGIVRVIYCQQFDRSDVMSTLRLATNLIQEYDLMTNDSARIFVDGSSPGFISSLKHQIAEYPDYMRLVEKAKQDKRDDQLYQYMKIVPVNFATNHKKMMTKLKKWLDYGKVGIDPDLYPDLITDLRIAEVKDDMTLEKKEHKHDLLDALRLSFEWYND